MKSLAVASGRPDMNDKSRRVFVNVCCGLGIMAGVTAIVYLVLAWALTLREAGLSVRAQLIAQRVITPVIFASLAAMAASAECLRRKIGGNGTRGRLLRWARVAVIVVIPFLILFSTVKTPFWSFPSPDSWNRPRFVYGWPFPWKMDGAVYPLTFTLNLALWTGYLMFLLGYRRFKSYCNAGVFLLALSSLLLSYTGISPHGKHRSVKLPQQNGVQQESNSLECGATAQNGTLCRLSDMVVRIDMQNLLKMPVGGTLQGEELWPWNYGLSSVKMPREWSDGAKCDALRVSDVLVDGETMSIRGGLGSKVYPTVAEGAFAMTNQIVAAVSEISSGKALVVPLRFAEKNRYCEMVFTWRPKANSAAEWELVVRGYVNGKRQMAVCCCLHTKGDGIKADFAMP